MPRNKYMIFHLPQAFHTLEDNNLGCCLFVFIKIRHAIVKTWGSIERYKEEKCSKT